MTSMVEHFQEDSAKRFSRDFSPVSAIED